ncbi:macro domain-containing protein [Nonomuraea maritima]|uniref:macro domain-containing protein n=1 Tax=Nonomuraea maritima TaxID=683260 RepID=UPI00371517A6
MGFVQGLQAMVRTPRGRSNLARHFLVSFGAVALLVLAAQAAGARLPDAAALGVPVVAGLIWAPARAYPRCPVTRQLTHPDVTVTVRVGDPLALDSDLVIGFADTFDTDLSGLRGQLLGRMYDGDLERLDSELDRALAAVVPRSVETRATKPRGKLKRYPLGTVATIGSPYRKVHCVASVRVDTDVTARASVDDLWLSLGRLWAAIAREGPVDRVAVPIVEADPDLLIKMVVLSFVAQARTRAVARELTLVVRRPDAGAVDLLETRAFLAAL